MIKVNDVVYIYERERKRLDAAGNYSGRGLWIAHTISGETKQSWLVSNGAKIAKNEPNKTRKTSDYGDGGVMKVSYSLEDVQNEEWARVNKRLIIADVEKTSVENLKKIAEIIGYEKEENTY